MMDHEDSNINIGRRGREVSVDKLELRLGPPSKEGVEVQRRRQNHHQQQQQQATAFAIPPPPPFGHILSSSNANYNNLSNVANKINNSHGVEFQKSYNCSSTQGSVHHQVSNGGFYNKRVAPSSAIGWPPIRSFRKKVITAAATSNYINNNNNKQFSEETSDDHNNIIINSTTEMDQHDEQGGHHIKKDQVMTTTAIDNNINKLEVASDSLYVKIYMDGFPIGRKLNLKAHHNYQSLSSAVDHLFRGILLPPAAAGSNESDDQVWKLGGLLDGNGEYTLVYEDNEGDRVLVGDVPWNMFLSTVKRLRVLKSSELSKATRSSQPNQ